MIPRVSQRPPDAAKVFLRAGMLFCGVALTWTCAALGLLVADDAFGGHRCGAGVKIASLRVREVDNAIAQYQIMHGRCPATPSDLADGEFISARDLVDPWNRGIRFTCTEEDTRVASAGPDKIFGTTDDIMNER